MNTLLKLPVWLLAIAIIAVVALMFSTLYFGPLTFNGQPLGFQDTTWRVKGWQATDVTIAKQNTPALLPVKANEGFCFITSVSGAFWGAGQGVSITQSGDDLYLNANSNAQSDAGLVAKVGCIRFFQSTHCTANRRSKSSPRCPDDTVLSRGINHVANDDAECSTPVELT
jgi:hypothetical protein